MLILHVYTLFLFNAIQFLHFNCFNLDVTHTIIYEDPSKGTGMRSSYFGFSLLLYSGSNSKRPWIQIGAPRGNDTNMYQGVKEPGVVYRCPISDTCKTVAFDKIRSGERITEFVNRKTNIYTDEKSGAWIGGAMDIDENGSRVAVCGHRWRYAKKQDKFYYMLGVCYWTNVDQNISDPSGVFKLLPLHKPDNYFHSHGDNPFYLLNYGVGQAGISVHFPKNKENPELFIGAPGVSNWKGSAVIYKASDNDIYKNYTFSEVLDPKSLGVEQYTLFGYQVTSGKFDDSNKYYYVAGNPKGSSKGKVFVFTYKDNTGVNVVKRLDGYQTGEYFGSSLAVADIDCSGTDDLIVGAPQYTENHDEGRIYIFLSNLQDTLFNSPIYMTGKILGGRFGTSITALGDLDKDGCDDIAIGAPYENNNTGAVYIYNGDPNRGLVLSQEIKADKIDPKLKGFGVSISRGTDIDSNSYLDVAVGAYMSDQAVIFRAQPVVTLSTNVVASVFELKKDAESFIIKVCLSYTGASEHVTNTLHVSRNIIVDEKFRRAHFIGKRNIFSSSVIIKNKNHCEDIEVYLMKTALEENTSDPIIVKVTQEVIDSGGDKTTVVIGRNPNTKSNDGFRKDFPVVNKRHSSQTAILSLPFANECDHNECEADLQLNSSFSGIINGVYVIGSKSKLTLDVNVTNNKQPAYRTVVHINIPSPIHLSNGHKNCKESVMSSGSLLLCNLGNPLRNGTLKNLTLHLDTSGVRPGSKNLTFLVSVTTSSKDQNKAQNSQNLELNFIVDADLVIMGRSEELIYNYAKTNKTVFKQRYEMQKLGSSPIEVAEVELKIPIGLTGYKEPFLDLFRPMAYLNAEQELACEPGENYKYHTEENTQRVESLDINLREKREAVQNELESQINETLFLNCSMPNVQCVKIKCYAGPFDSDLQESASIELKMILNIHNLDDILGDKTTIYLTTEGSVSIKEPKIIHTSQRAHHMLITTSFANDTYVQEAAEQVDTWIITVSVIVGILILTLVVFGFMKAGFFERKRKEELKSLRADYAANVFPVGITHNKQMTDGGDDDDTASACDSRDELKQEDSEEL